MITKAEQRLMAKYGTVDPDAIVKQKSVPQVKKMPATKSFTVTVSKPDCEALCMLAGFECLDGYENRIIEYTLSDERVDRDGDILIQNGADLDNFKGNPVALLFHDSKSFPVGICIKIWVDQAERALKGWFLFFDDRIDTSGMSERAFRYAKSRAMRAGSVGFMPLEVKFPTAEERRALDMKDYGVIFTRWELCEFTFCPVPSNPGALSDAIRNRSLRLEDLAFVETEKPDDEVLDMTKEELSALVNENLKKALAEVQKGDTNPSSLEACAKACKACAEACGDCAKKNPDCADMCNSCVEACLECAQMCADMAKGKSVFSMLEKAGRPISAANLQKMSAIYEKMDKAHKAYKAEHKACMADMKAFMDEHNPKDPDGDGDDDTSQTGDTDQDAGQKSAEDLELEALAQVLKGAKV